MAKFGTKREYETAEDAMRETRSATAKKPKPRSLPPPGEAFRDSELATRSASKKKATARQAPARFTVSAKSTSFNGQTKAGSGVGKTIGARRGRPPKAKPLEMMKFLADQSATRIEFPTKELQGPGVLYRITARAKKDKADQSSMLAAEKVSGKVGVGTVNKNKTIFPLMKLPKDVRVRIWRHAVVYPSFFIWPNEERGREQPDLAMVCRRIREEVLPIYYAENIFAVKLSPLYHHMQKGDERLIGQPTNVSITKSQLPKSIAVIEKWANGLKDYEGGPGWFAKIRRWAFSYDPNPEKSHKILSIEQDGSFVVSIAYAKREDGGWRNESVEIHCEGCCVLPGHSEYGRCHVMRTPDWLNMAVYTTLDASRGGDILSEKIVECAMAIRKNAPELVESRCEKVMSSIEVADAEMGDS